MTAARPSAVSHPIALPHLVALTAALAFAASAPAALAARDVAAVESHAGAWRSSFWVQTGGSAAPVTAAVYRALVDGGACRAGSHVEVWPARHEVVFLCRT
jgi:hypothetical protein